MKPRSGRLEQKAEKLHEMVGAHSRPHVSEDELVATSHWRVFMVLKYTEAGNVLKIMRFQRECPNQKTPCRQTVMDNYNKYVGLSLKRNIGKLVDVAVRKLPWNIMIVSRTLPISVYFKTINIRSSTENCGVGCAPAIFVQFFCFLFHSPVPFLGFTHRKALEQF